MILKAVLMRPKAVVNTAKPKAVLNAVKGNQVNAVKASACWVSKPKTKVLDHVNPQIDLQDQGVIDSGCLRHVTGNMSYLIDFEEIDEGYVAFRGNPKGGKITGKGDNEKKVTKELGKEGGDSSNDQEKDDNVNNTNNVNTASTNEVNAVGAKTSIELLNDPNMPELEDIVYSDDDEDVGAEADMNNLNTFMPISPIITTRIHKDHPVEQIIRDLNLAPQTRRKKKNLEEHRLNKKDERGIMIKNKAKLVAQGYTQEVGIDYDEVFALVARIEAIRLFLAYTSFKDIVVYQIDVKSAFLYGKIEEEVYVCQPPGFEDPDFPDRVYKVEKALDGLHQAPRAWYETLLTYLLDNGFQRGKIDKTLFIRRDKGDILLVQVYVDDIIFGSTKKSLCTEFEKMMHKKFQISSMGELIFFLGLQEKQKEDGIFISQDKYVTEILKKFGFTDVKTASTPIETQKPLIKDEDGEEVDVHLYRSMIGSLMYLTSSRPDIIFAVCAFARYQVNPKVSHLHAVKRIFRYLKGQPKLGLCYPKDSPFDLVAYTDSDYDGASLDRKSTIGGCQFIRCRLISWQCKKQTIVANSITEAEYVAAKCFGFKINCLIMGFSECENGRFCICQLIGSASIQSIMGFLARERFCDMDAQPNSNSGAFDQDVLASPVWALARIGTFMGRLSTQSNSLPIGRQYNKRESLRMGPLSDAEPMREGESIWEKGGLRAFKNQWKGKTCSLHSFLSKESH
ncbi:putative ribonuclease H-like domain-containing protein [Tanacetum coccineum]|uniref:Ribonuclease H-like domain-containing protein n=1 Tax=Tanacetum coccineum TaxID=301880 RepID=A0ABQ5BHE0_9ASTR